MGTLVFQANLGGAVNLVGPNTASTVNFTLPSADGTNGQALVTNGTGTLSFATVTTAAGGSNTQVQFNSSGAFAGSSNLTFNGTTLTAANTSVTTSETLSYGTANGVAYLNGSKVVTTGSALVFDGTNLGIGTSSPANKLHVYSTTSGTLAKLEGTTNNLNLQVTNTSGGFYYGVDDSVGGTTGTAYARYVYGTGAYPVLFYTNTTKQMTLDSSGNLGLGVTPSAWSLGKAIDIAGGVGLLGYNNATQLTANAYYNGGWIYKASSFATNYAQTSGQHQWSVAASGTAGNAITFTQAMTLDASGNLGIGTTSPGSGMRVDITMQSGYEGYAGLRVRGPSTNNSFAGGIDWISNDGTTVVNKIGNSTSGMLFYTANTERARIDSSGNMGIGTSSPAYKLDVNGRISYNGAIGEGAATTVSSSSTNLIFGQSSTWQTNLFYTNGSERARITSSGYFKASNNGSYLGSTSSYHEFASNVSNSTLWITNSNTTPYGFAATYTSVSPNNTTSEFIACADTLAQRATIRSNGGLANYSANNVNLSDQREKTNFAPAGDYLSKICAIPVQTFNYIDQNLEDDPGTTLGVVAQDVQAVAPELVMESNWGTEDAPKMRLSIYQTDLQYALMKALQELKAEFDAYKASHP